MFKTAAFMSYSVRFDAGFPFRAFFRYCYYYCHLLLAV